MQEIIVIFIIKQLIHFYVDYVVHIDAKNPECAARLCQAFTDCNKLLKLDKIAMISILEMMIQKHTLSKNTYEIITKILATNTN